MSECLNLHPSMDVVLNYNTKSKEDSTIPQIKEEKGNFKF